MKIFPLLSVQKNPLDEIDARWVPLIATFHHSEGLAAVTLLPVTLQVGEHTPSIVYVL